MIVRTRYGAVLGLCISLIACGGDRQTEHNAATFSGESMGVSFAVRLTDLPYFADRKKLQDTIQRTLNETDSRLSIDRNTSELLFINQNRDIDQAMLLSPEITQVMAEGLRIGALTGGAYDISAGPLNQLWNSPAGDVVPSDADIKAALERVGQDKIALDAVNRSFRKLHPDIFLDLSSLGHGHAADRLARVLEDMQIKNYMINLGGVIRLRGINQNGESWRIPLDKHMSDAEIQKALQLNDAGMASAGNWDLIGDKSAQHPRIINSKTGRPVQHDLAWVTVIAPSSMTAHAWTAALLALGPEQGYALAVRENLAAFFMIKANAGFEEKTTPGFERYIVEIPAQAAAH
jgi:thiamine biosynthesis lipoprotein